MRGIAITMNGKDLSSEDLIDLWLHGHYLHKGNESLIGSTRFQ
jgi:hypothetical protein